MARMPHSPSKTNDLFYETFYAGAIGGSTLALIFLASDAVRGQAFFTPSVLGQTLLMGKSLAATQPLDLEAVAWFSAVHFALFGVLGLLGAVLVRTIEAHERRPAWVTLVLFGVMEAGALLPLRLAVPELATMLGYTRVSTINLLTAAVMVAFLHYARAEEEAARAEAGEGRMENDPLRGADRTGTWAPPFVERG